MSGSRQVVTFGRIEERSFLGETTLLEENMEREVRRGSGVDSVETKGTAASGTSGLSAAAQTDLSSGSETTRDSALKVGGR